MKLISEAFKDPLPTYCSNQSWRSVTKQDPCRGCGKSDWCRYSEDGGAICRRCEDAQGLAGEDKNGENYVYLPPVGATGNDRSRSFVFTTKPTPEPASVELRNKAYERICAELTLTSQHTSNLTQRGLTPDAIRFHGFRSGSSDWSYRVSIAQKIASLLPSHWQSIPGLFANGSTCDPALVAVSSGIWIPAKNILGQIQAVKIRKDHAGQGESRYRTLSSTGYGGAGSGQVCSFWATSNLNPISGVLRVTEGELKACVATEKTGIESFAAPGVAALASPVIISWLQTKNPKKILVAPDRDAFTNTHVRVHTLKALEAYQALASSHNYEVAVEVWEGPNGIDDALVAGMEILNEPLDSYLERLKGEAAADTRSENSRVTILQQRLLEKALVVLGGACDGAKFQDGAGFNARDTGFFAPHLATASQGGLIAPGFRKKVLERLEKYRDQLFRLQINVNDLAHQEEEFKKTLRAGDSEKEPSQAERILELTESWELFQSDGQPHASFLVKCEDHSYKRETHRFSRGGVRQFLIHAYLREYSRPPSTEAIAQALMTLEAQASIDGKEQKVWIRVGRHEDRVYLDLNDAKGQVVEVSEAGWRLTQDPPVRFFRPKSMLPLEVPCLGGSINELRPMMNVPNDAAWILTVSWLLFAFIPERPHPILLLEGEQGSAKSTFQRILRMLYDPHSTPIRRQPKDIDAAAVMCGSNWTICLDNLATVEDWLSDFLCTVATGGGVGKRALYSNDEEFLVNYLRPIILNGIGGLTGKPDLGDRLLKIVLPTITDNQRVDERLCSRK
jgi:hypothetical protein